MGSKCDFDAALVGADFYSINGKIVPMPKSADMKKRKGAKKVSREEFDKQESEAVDAFEKALADRAKAHKDREAKIDAMLAQFDA